MNTPSTYRLELKERILEVAMREFTARGIKAVKMDEISKILSISKRTLYEIYSDKETLLYEGIRRHHEAYEASMDSYASHPRHNVMDILLESYQRQLKMNGVVNPLFYAEVHKYPLILDYIQEKRRQRQTHAIDFLRRGVKEGFFRPDVDYEIILKIGELGMTQVMERQLYKVYDMQDIIRNLVFVFIRGFCTEQGIKRLDKFLERT